MGIGGKVLAVTILALLAGGADAADVWHTSTIKWIYPQANGSAVITFTDQSPSCTNTNTYKYHLLSVGTNGVTAEGFQIIYAAALAAAASGLTITINFDDSTTACSINRLYVRYDS